MRRIKICQLITELGPAGAERCVYELSRRLDRDRFDVQVMALRGGAVAGWLSEAGIRVTVLDIRGRWDVRGLVRLARLLREEQIDLLHAHLFHADLVARPAASLAAVPHLVHTVHTAEGRFRPWQFAYARFTAAACERIVCVSESARDFHARRSGLPPWRYTVIHNGLDAGAFARDESSRRRLRTEWNLGDDRVLTAYVGRLDHEKGLDLLLSATSHLAARGRPVDLVIAGDGPQRRMVENFIAHGEGGRRCRYVGFLRDVRDILSAADMFIMPSRWEGFGLAAAEAMAASLPVIASDIPALRDLLGGGSAGLLVEPTDSVSLAEAMERLADDPPLRAAMGDAGRRRVVEAFPIEANIAAHEKLYSELVFDAV